VVSPDSSDSVPSDVVRAFAEASRCIFASEDLGGTLRRIADAAVELVPACDLASITVSQRDAFRTFGSTDPRALAADEAQYAADEGPCLHAIRHDTVVRTPDAATDDRWPRFAQRLAGSPIGAVVSCRLSVEEGTDGRAMGSLNMYSLGVDTFGAVDLDVARLIGAHAGVVLHAVAQAQNLRQALESRDAIGQAKGILMERERITADEAFDRLRVLSQRMNVKLRWLAERLVLTGEADLGDDDAGG
jgi:GAF domain-containing protein